MHAVTCRTEECANNGYTLILTSPGHTIVCGPCGETITDVEPLIPEGVGEPSPPEEPTNEEPEGTE